MPPDGRWRRPAAAVSTALAAILLLLHPAPGAGQSVSGRVWNDVNGDGVMDAGEAGLSGFTVTAFGPAGAGASTTTSDGTFTVAAQAGCQGIHLATSAGWRRSLPDQTWCPDGSVGEPALHLRYGAPPRLLPNLEDGSFLYISLGDSIAAGVSFCADILGQDTGYVEDVKVDLECLAGTTIAVENRAVGGWESDDLLTTQYADIFGRRQPNPQFIPTVVSAGPDLVTISIGGNDFLNTEPGTLDGQTFPYDPVELELSFRELIAARQSVQETLSVLTSELPDADVEINTVYDNLAGACDTTDFHAAAPALWNQMLRHVAWGQTRPVILAEVAHELAHQDVLRASCCGALDRICRPDSTHPSPEGALILQHAVMESLGRVEVAPTGVTSGFDIGYQQLVATLVPTVAEDLSATATNPDAALTRDDAGAIVSTPGGWMELSGFSLPSDVVPSRVVAVVRYRTAGTFTNDRHRFSASYVNFVAPAYTFAGWDTETPIVGGSGRAGNNGGGPSVVNALPNVAAWREASAMVTLDALDDGRTAGYFTWPSPTASDIANLRIRLTTEAVGAPDSATVEWDAAWVLVYGTRAGAAVPGEVSPPGSSAPLRVAKDPGGLRLAWGSEPASATYRVYHGALGLWSAATCQPELSAGGCSATLELVEPQPPDASRRAFYLVAGVSAAGVQGPLGTQSDGTSRTSGAATCP
jgi:lysophospholipase L1-like esterase